MFRKIVLGVIVLLGTHRVFAQDGAPLVGKWRLNFSESKFVSGPPAYRRLILKIEQKQDGIRVVYDMIATRGGVTHWEWTGPVDGKDYPLEGVEEAVTNAYSRIDDRTFTVVTKLDGRVTSTTQIVLSADGKKMTVTTGANTAIYERQ